MVILQTGRRPQGTMSGFCWASAKHFSGDFVFLSLLFVPFLSLFGALWTVFDITEVIIWPQRVYGSTFSVLRIFISKFSSLHINKDSVLFTVKIMLLWNGSFVCQMGVDWDSLPFP